MYGFFFLIFYYYFLEIAGNCIWTIQKKKGIQAACLLPCHLIFKLFRYFHNALDTFAGKIKFLAFNEKYVEKIKSADRCLVTTR